VGARRGRWRRLCARVALDTLPRGRSSAALGHMETMWAAAWVLSPFGIFISLLIPAVAIALARGPYLSAARLAAGYIGALCALAVVVAATSYVSPEKSVSVWHVPPDRYWGALTELLVGTYVVAAFAAIMGISFVGLPVLVWLSGSGKATAPWLILTAGAISTAVAIVLYGLTFTLSNISFFETLVSLVVTHVVSATGFVLAARLPWVFRLKG
jgi:hypothetical protein